MITNSLVEQVSIAAAAIPLVLLAPGIPRSAAGTSSDCWLDAHVSGTPGYNPGWHSSRICAGGCSLFQDQPISGLPHVTLKRVPGFWECTGEEAATQSLSFLFHRASLSLLLMGPHLEMRNGRRNLYDRSYFHLAKHLGLL